eukprot:g10996.t1
MSSKRKVLVAAGLVVAAGAAGDWYCRTPLISREQADAHVQASGLVRVLAADSSDQRPIELAAGLCIRLVRTTSQSVNHMSMPSSTLKLAKLQLIAHSVAAFAIDAVARSVLSCEGRLDLKVTFLDPFQLRGLLDGGYGRRNFGRYNCLDGDKRVSVESIFCQGSPFVRGGPIDHAVLHDVTHCPEQQTWIPAPNEVDIPMDKRKRLHYWPIEYYIRNYSVFTHAA